MEKNQKKILVIDDEYDVRELISDFLQLKGYSIVMAENGKHGIDLFNKENPDIILCDLQMPEMDGLGVLKHIKQVSNDKPVIVISGTGVLQDAIGALKHGAWDYLEKPIPNMEVLEFAVKRALDKSMLVKENKRYQEELEFRIKERTKELHARTLELIETNAKLTDEIKVRVKAEEEVRKINEELEQRVQDRTAELSTTLEKLQEDEEAGRKIQNRLLPPPETSLSKYQFSSILMPSMYLSGDFIDYFQLNKDHICFYVADVSGHGASSAFVTVFLKSFMGQIIKNYKDDNDSTIFDPAKILHLLNHQLLSEDLEKHLTLFYGIINVKRNSILYCNGGQYPFPILLNGENTYYIEKKGTPVGLFDFTKYINHEFTLPEKFSMFIASDGVIDILPQKRLKEKENYLLSSLNDIDCSLNDIVEKLDLNNKDNLPDDITLMMIKRRN